MAVHHRSLVFGFAPRRLAVLAAFALVGALHSGGVLADDTKAKILSRDTTNIDFSETMIDGKMQAPAGFFLQGRQAQSMTQMVKLRSKFRSELRNSKAAVKAVVK